MPFEERNTTNLFFLFNKEKLNRFSKLNIKALFRYLSIYLSGSYKVIDNKLSFSGISSENKQTLYILRSFTTISNTALAAQFDAFLRGGS